MLDDKDLGTIQGLIDQALAAKRAEPHDHDGINSPYLNKKANDISVPITADKGGTGLTTLTPHYLLVGNGTGNVNQITPDTAGKVMTSNGTGSDPSFQTLNVTTLSNTFTYGETLAANDAVAVRSGTTIDATASQTTQDASYSAYGTNWVGQTFQTDASAKEIVGGTLYLGNTGTLFVNYHIFLYETSAGLPTGSALVDLVLPAYNITSTGEVSFTFNTPVAVTGSTTYALVLAYGSGDVSHIINVYYKGSNAYANGSYISTSNGGSTWTADTNKDLYFKVNQSFYTPGYIYKSSALNIDELSKSFIGFVTAGGNAGSSGTVVTNGQLAGFSNLIPGLPYYLSDTAGAISVTQGTNVRKVGVAIDASTLLIDYLPVSLAVGFSPVAASGVVAVSYSTPGATSSQSFVKFKQFTAPFTGSYALVVTYYTSNGSNAAFIEAYKNGVDTGTGNGTNATIGSPATQTLTISATQGDTVELWYKGSGGYSCTINSLSVGVAMVPTITIT